MNATVARSASLVRRSRVLQCAAVRPAALSLWARWKGSTAAATPAAAAAAAGDAKKGDAAAKAPPAAAAPATPEVAPAVKNPTTFEVKEGRRWFLLDAGDRCSACTVTRVLVYL